MKEKIKDTIVDLLFDGVKEKLDCVKENQNFDTYNSLTPNWYYKVLR